jgi:hypothetical protein
VSVESENSFGLRFATSGIGPWLCACYDWLALPSVDATVQLSRLVETGGSDPTNFLGGRKPKKWGRPSRPLWQFSGRCFRGLVCCIAFSFRGVRGHRVKTLLQDEVQREIVTFFTVRGPTASCANDAGTVLEGPMLGDGLTCNATYPMDSTSRFRQTQRNNLPCLMSTAISQSSSVRS